MNQRLLIASVLMALLSGSIDAQTKPGDKLIYLDSSISMMGFLGRGHSYSLFLERLESELDLIGLPGERLKRRTVGDNLAVYNGQLVQFAENKGLYTGKNTNLAAAADDIASGKPSLAMIITDAEFDFHPTAGGDDCVSGFDLYCLQNKFKKLVQAPHNYSFIVLGFKSKYSAPYIYPPGQPALALAAPISKPVYLFILAQELREGLKVANHMRTYLANLAKTDGQNEIRTLRIAPVVFPVLEAKAKLPESLITTKFKKLVFSRERVSVQETEESFNYRKQANMVFGDEVIINVPLSSDAAPYDDAYNFVTSLKNVSWLQGTTKIDGPGKVSVEKEGQMKIVLTPGVTQASFLRSKPVLSFELITEIENRDESKIWRDWNCSSTQYSESSYIGKTMNISDFLEFLVRFLNFDQIEKQPTKKGPSFRIAFIS